MTFRPKRDPFASAGYGSPDKGDTFFAIPYFVFLVFEIIMSPGLLYHAVLLALSPHYVWRFSGRNTPLRKQRFATFAKSITVLLKALLFFWVQIVHLHEVRSFINSIYKMSFEFRQ